MSLSYSVNLNWLNLVICEEVREITTTNKYFMTQDGQTFHPWTAQYQTST